MKTILKSFSAIGALSILAAGVYVNTSTEQTNDNIVKDINSQEIIIADYKEEPIQIPVIKDIETDTEPINDLKGLKVIPKPEPVKPVIQKPVVKPEPVKEQPVEETKEKPVEKIKKEPVEPVDKEVKKPVEEKITVPVKKVEEIKKPEPVKKVKPGTDSIKAMDRARDLTKGYCSPELWVEWDTNDQSAAGLAYRSIVYWEDKSQPDIQTITTTINPELDGEIAASIHVAWHECAHAKTYSIPVDKVEEITKEIKRVFPESEYGRIELLADAMAHIKTGFEAMGYYQQEFTQEQLDVAKKIWELSPEITTEMEYDYDAYIAISNIG